MIRILNELNPYVHIFLRNRLVKRVPRCYFSARWLLEIRRDVARQNKRYVGLGRLTVHTGLFFSFDGTLLAITRTSRVPLWLAIFTQGQRDSSSDTDIDVFSRAQSTPNNLGSHLYPMPCLLLLAFLSSFPLASVHITYLAYPHVSR